MLSDQEFKRIDQILSAVIKRPGLFSSFEIDFAMSNADRLDKYGNRTRFSEAQMSQIDRIGDKITAQAGEI